MAVRHFKSLSQSSPASIAAQTAPKFSLKDAGSGGETYLYICTNGERNLITLNASTPSNIKEVNELTGLFLYNPRFYRPSVHNQTFHVFVNRNGVNAKVARFDLSDPSAPIDLGLSQSFFTSEDEDRAAFDFENELVYGFGYDSDTGSDYVESYDISGFPTTTPIDSTGYSDQLHSIVKDASRNVLYGASGFQPRLLRFGANSSGGMGGTQITTDDAYLHNPFYVEYDPINDLVYVLNSDSVGEPGTALGVYDPNGGAVYGHIPTKEIHPRMLLFDGLRQLVFLLNLDREIVVVNLSDLQSIVTDDIFIPPAGTSLQFGAIPWHDAKNYRLYLPSEIDADGSGELLVVDTSDSTNLQLLARYQNPKLLPYMQITGQSL